MVNIGDVIFQIIMLLFVVLFFVSLFLFIRGLLKKQFYKNADLKRMEDKLDKILENQGRQMKD